MTMRIAAPATIALLGALLVAPGTPANAAPGGAADPSAPHTTPFSAHHDHAPRPKPTVPKLEAPAASDAPAYAPGHVLVRFSAKATPSQQRSSLSALGTKATDTVDGTGWVQVDVGTQDPAAVVTKLDADPRVADVQVDHVRHAFAVPNDPLVPSAPYFDLVRLPRAWDASTGTGEVVAVLDSGVDSSNPDLTGSVLPGTDLVDGDSTPEDVDGHGTLVAGVVAAHANNSIGTVGAAYGAQILPVKVLDDSGSGNDLTIAEGIDWATAHGADVINLSLGGAGESPILLTAIQNAVREGVVVVAAAGNNGTDEPMYPAAYAPQVDGLLAVGSTGDYGALSSFSSWGDWVSIAAPGEQIYGPNTSGSSTYGSGTSFAAPFVSAVAALVLAHSPGLSPVEVEQRLESTAVDAGPRGIDPYYGHGVLDAAAAVTAADATRAAPAVPFDRAPADPGASDDTRATARALVAAGSTGTISPEGDTDWYKFTASATGWYDVSLDLQPTADDTSTFDPVIEVRDDAGDILGTDASVGSYAHVSVPVTAAATYYVKVSNAEGTASDEGYEIWATPGTAPVPAPPANRGWLKGITPAPNSAGVSVHPTVTVALERALDPASVTSQTVRLVDGTTGADVPATLTYSSATSTINLTPAGNLSAGSPYEVIVDGLTDTDSATQDHAIRTFFTVAANGSRFTPIDPLRIEDTRSDGGPVQFGQRLILDLSGLAALGGSAVVLNVTATNITAPGDIRVYPSPSSGNGAPPLVSNLNVVPGVIEANAVTVALGADGTISLAPMNTSADLIVDVAGYYSTGGAAAFEPVAPVRVMDTRNGTGGVPVGLVTGTHKVDLQVTGRNGVPADAVAVVLNVTGTGALKSTYVRAYPTPGATEDQTGPHVSNLNLPPARALANLVTVKIGDGGRVRFDSPVAGTNLIADLAGYYTATGDNGFVPLAPVRLADTRKAQGLTGALGMGVTKDLQVTGAQVPANATAAILNVTGVHPTGPTYIKVFPTTAPASPAPTASTLNLIPGRDEANLTIARLGTTGKVSFYNYANITNLVIDASGYFRH